MNICAIGGGELKDGETLPIDRFIVKQVGRKSPRALFIPTASGDASAYCESFDKIYGKKLGCQTEHLLLGQCKDNKQIEAQILRSDLIYVGGGNTLKMMKCWRKLKVDHYLKKAGRRGTILAGLSAGAICWYQWGHSDSQSFASTSKWSFIRVKGLGFLPGSFCPHLDFERRHKPFSDMIQKHNDVGIACDNNAAIWYQDGCKPKVIVSKENATVRVYRLRAGSVDFDTYAAGDFLKV